MLPHSKLKYFFSFLDALNEELRTQAVIANKALRDKEKRGVFYAELLIIQWVNWSRGKENESKVESYGIARKEGRVDLDYLVGREVSFWTGVGRRRNPIRFGTLQVNKDSRSSTVHVFNKHGLPINPECVYDLLVKYAVPE